MRIFACLDKFAIKLVKTVTNIDDVFIGMLSLDSLRSINILNKPLFFLRHQSPKSANTCVISLAHDTPCCSHLVSLCLNLMKIGIVNSCLLCLTRFLIASITYEK